MRVLAIATMQMANEYGAFYSCIHNRLQRRRVIPVYRSIHLSLAPHPHQKEHGLKDDEPSSIPYTDYLHPPSSTVKHWLRQDIPSSSLAALNSSSSTSAVATLRRILPQYAFSSLHLSVYTSIYFPSFCSHNNEGRKLYKFYTLQSKSTVLLKEYIGL